MAVFVALGAFLMTPAGGWTHCACPTEAWAPRSRRPSPILGGCLGLFGGALLCPAAAEILPEAHHEHPTRSTVLCTIAGAAFIWLVVGGAE